MYTQTAVKNVKGGAMKVTFQVVADNDALAEVQLVEFRNRLVRIPDVQVGSADRSSGTDRVVRLGGLELLATFVTSAAAYQLAAAVRDFVKRQRFDIQLTHPDGRQLTISSKGENPENMAEVVAFLTEGVPQIPRTPP